MSSDRIQHGPEYLRCTGAASAVPCESRAYDEPERCTEPGTAGRQCGAHLDQQRCADVLRRGRLADKRHRDSLRIREHGCLEHYDQLHAGVHRHRRGCVHQHRSAGEYTRAATVRQSAILTGQSASTIVHAT